jgi:hypothetical protein
MSTIKYFIFLAVALPVFLSPAVAGIYSWVDQNGEKHYSDTPEEGSEPVDLPPTNTFSSPATVPLSAGGDDELAEAPAYNEFEISSPAQEQVLWNTAGVVPVTLAPSPRLKNGHRIQMFLDGAEVKDYPGRSLSHQLEEVERGTHSLRAIIVDPAGKQLTATQAVTFTVQQNSVLNPNNPNNVFSGPR